MSKESWTNIVNQARRKNRMKQKVVMPVFKAVWKNLINICKLRMYGTEWPVVAEAVYECEGVLVPEKNLADIVAGYRFGLFIVLLNVVIGIVLSFFGDTVFTLAFFIPGVAIWLDEFREVYNNVGRTPNLIRGGRTSTTPP